MASSGRGLWGKFWGQLDAATYRYGLIQSMRTSDRGDLDLWLGDWARVRGHRPVVSYAQGPPGTDARSVANHRDLIQRLAGPTNYYKLVVAASYRLNLGLPKFANSDQIIVGSQWSRDCLHHNYGISSTRTHAIPYPIDVNEFRPSKRNRDLSSPLSLLWLGRFVPRKRLDLFLDGLAIAIRQGSDVNALIVGQSGFVPNYERLIESFSFPDRIEHRQSVPRSEVPMLISECDVMCQPSDEENFGSSVAEALACGIPAIVGATNGTGDYICERSTRLVDDKPETMAAAIVAMADAKKRGDLTDPDPSRLTAEKFFDPERVIDQLEAVLKIAVESGPSSDSSHLRAVAH